MCIVLFFFPSLFLNFFHHFFFFPPSSGFFFLTFFIPSTSPSLNLFSFLSLSFSYLLPSFLPLFVKLLFVSPLLPSSFFPSLLPSSRFHPLFLSFVYNSFMFFVAFFILFLSFLLFILFPDSFIILVLCVLLQLFIFSIRPILNILHNAFLFFLSKQFFSFLSFFVR